MKLILIMAINLMLMINANIALSKTNLNKVHVLAMPPSGYYKAKSTKSAEFKPLKLKVAKKESNSIIDVDEWFKSNKFAMPIYYAKDPPYYSSIKELPTDIPTIFNGKGLLQVYDFKRQYVVTYGDGYWDDRYLVVINKNTRKIEHAFDFINYKCHNEESKQQNIGNRSDPLMHCN